MPRRPTTSTSSRKSAQSPLATLRIKKGMTQLEVGLAAGTTQATVSYAERHPAGVSDYMRQKIAKALKTSIKKLFPQPYKGKLRSRAA